MAKSIRTSHFITLESSQKLVTSRGTHTEGGEKLCAILNAPRSTILHFPAQREPYRWRPAFLVHLASITTALVLGDLWGCVVTCLMVP